MRVETIQTSDLARGETRLPRWMLGLGLAGALFALLTGHGEVSAGFALGASLAILNYFWLHQAIEAVLGAGSGRVSKKVIVQFVVRYPLVFAVLYVLYRTGWLPFPAILAGLFVPVAGVLIEAVYQIYGGWQGS